MGDFESVKLIQEIYNKKHSINLITTSKFFEFDLIDEKNKYLIEVKQRNNLSTQYKTAIIGYNKILKAKQYLDDNYNIEFIMIYTDGIFSYKYTGEELKIENGGIKSKFTNLYKKYAYLEISKMVKI
jgi:hypothetical protein